MSDHPFFFTWTAQRDAQPIHITGGSGAHFTTADGATWTDLASLTYQANLGHGHPRMIAAVQRQAAELCLTTPSAIYPAKVELAQRLLALAPPGFSKVFFTLGGAEAVENAVKIARLFTGRYKLISRYRSYHGATLGALTLSGDYRRPPLEPGLTGVIHVLDNDLFALGGATLPGGRLTTIDRVIALEGPQTVAGVILESIPGANGVYVPPPGYWRQVRDACDQHGVLLIADEVLTGFGRTGKMFAIEHFDGVVPDMITVGKALTGGYGVLGAVLVHDRVARHFDDKPLLAGLTHYAHPLGCAAALEALNIYRDEDLISRAAALEPDLLNPLRALQAAYPAAVTDVRGRGLLAAIDFGGATNAQFKAICNGLSDRRVLTHPRAAERMIVISPPLCIAPADLSQGLSALADAVAAALS
jgi:taurine---2-oxoglutarate transaminase